ELPVVSSVESRGVENHIWHFSSPAPVVGLDIEGFVRFSVRPGGTNKHTVQPALIVLSTIFHTTKNLSLIEIAGPHGSREARSKNHVYSFDGIDSDAGANISLDAVEKILSHSGDDIDIVLSGDLLVRLCL